QPEFTQIDIETSFMSMGDIMTMTEKMMQMVMKVVKGIDIKLPFQCIRYDEAMRRFDSDKLDTRYIMELIDDSDLFIYYYFNVFKSDVQSGRKVCLLNVKNEAENFSRKQIDELTEYVKVYGAKGLAWLKVDGNQLTGPIAKFLSDEESHALKGRSEAESGDLLLFVADQ